MALEEHAELVVKTKSGESYTIAESRIVKGSLTASSSCSSGGGIPAGACNIGTASVAFRAPSGLTYKKLYRAKVEIYAWYQGYSKELYGTYNVSSAENNYGVYTLSLSDNISLLDESCYAANDTENAENWLYSQMAGRWNVPSVILNYICNAYNVPHYNAAENEKYVPDSGNTALATGVSSECSVESVKDFANYLAEYLGCFIAAAPDGRVRFSRLGEREYKTELNQSNISRGTLQRSPYYVHPSIWKVSFDSGYGSSWYVSSDLPDDAAPLSINITNNPFWQVQEDRVPADIYGGKVTQMIKYMWDYLYNAAVRKDGNTVEYMINPFSCTVHVPYHFRIGDIVTVRDYVNGDVFRSYLTDITWTFRGGQQISCAGDDTRTLSVGTSRSAAKKSNDYSKYLYRKSKTGSSGGDTNTYTKAEIDAKDASVRSAADKAQETADGAVSVNNTQNTQIAALQKSAHAHSNKDVLDKTTASYTTAEKTKLAGIADGANKYAHPTTSGNKHIPSGGRSGQILRWSADGTAVWGADNNTTYGDVTQSAHGLMTAADKKKLDGIAAGATKVAVDSALSATSTNPVQNKAVKAALDSKSASGHTHTMITNRALLVSGANNTAKWVKLGTLVSSGNFSNAMIRVWSGDGANGRANQNSSFEVQIKDGWQSTESATKACGVTVYRIDCSSVKVKVIPTAHDTYTVWVYLPWTYWNGNYAVYGKYKSWTPQPLIQSDEPEGTGADTAYYDQAFLTSTVAAAQTLVDSGWQVPTFPSGISQSSIRYRKQGKIVSVTGSVKFSASTAAKTVLTLPEEYRPPKKIQQFNAVDSSSQPSFLTMIDTDGTVRFVGKTQGFFDTTSYYYIHCTFFVD